MKVKRNKEEYGGFLPLELNPGKEYFSKYDNNVGRFNTYKSAFKYLVDRIIPEEIYLPYYYCPTTIDAIRKMGSSVHFYHIDEKLRPINVPDKENSAIVIVDYFGVCDEQVRAFVDEYNKSEIIIDRAHSFFAEPIICKNIHNIYVAKKFFGVPDGAYLISEMVQPYNEILTNAYGYSDYLFKAYELGTNASYADKKKVDKFLSEEYGHMSLLSKGLLCNVDYLRVKTDRENNYSKLQKAFANINDLNVPSKVAAYQFPLLVNGKGRFIKEKLVKDKIYVSTLWSGDDLKKDGTEFEISMMKDTIFLPMDQRYDEEDMDYIISTTEEYYREYIE